MRKNKLLQNKDIMERMGNIINKLLFLSLILCSNNTFLFQKPNAYKGWNERAIDKLKKEG